jgi:hypothetical protein
MISVACPESSKDDLGQSSNGLDRGEGVDVARKRPSRIVRSIVRFAAQRPGFCLGAALSAGIALGWWVKRR